MFRDDLFRGARVLVTGGGTGLGRMMAERLLALGAAVEIWGRRGEVLAEAAAAMNAAHPGMAAHRTVDIKDPEAVEAAVAAMWAEGRPATHLINNAAGNFVSRTEDLSPRAFHAIADIVFHGTFQVTQALGKRWIREGTGGAVVSIIVTWVRTGAPFVVPSAMSKAGIDAMTKSLAVEWGRHGIRLNAIAPGTIPTEGMFARLRPGENDPAARAAERNPMRRIGTAQDIGDLAAFLLSPIWINGETIALDGGNWLTAGGGFHDYLAWGDTEWAEARARIKARNEADRAQRG
ncbi:SDR family oxidoreductase [Roseomonas alkaliterrae]|uniref:NAD(P)-dependent dehydrogenase (Short-subunit alcohol dehydrogenase family) n=1 Tax=Neoroseomonas alkaliterrae TaxID=1452450 RepID=A0A840XS50_9PROT|nr:SDR family oxidoreductase [Neoroseomonas alkaliterrae]MBB5689780.1 NAD(P)-dependent dehydrogenase (short-subunit alcohol dehydrogenase family) [Neoroseomonas alkaliterrae]MBR0674924.1 SDR family oxidoreductase [Neoroseomonas alkaliterrae]